MPRTFTLVFAFVLIAIAGAGSFLALPPVSVVTEPTGGPPPGEFASRVVGPDHPVRGVVGAGLAARADVADSSPAPKASAERAGRMVRLDEALKALDLIRPGRTKPAAPFAVSTPDGKGFRLDDQRGKVVFINFWATWCPPCREEMPAMDRLYARHRESGFVMIAVSVDADPNVVRPFLKEGRFTFAVGLDPKMELANAYGVRALPSSFIVDRQGNLMALALGPRAWDSDASHALIAGLVR